MLPDGVHEGVPVVGGVEFVDEVGKGVVEFDDVGGVALFYL